VFSLYLSFSVSVRLSAAPQTGCLHLGKKTSSPTVTFPVALVSNNWLLRNSWQLKFISRVSTLVPKAVE
jgi:hypothetical protein